jgi:hypothetical protein
VLKNITRAWKKLRTWWESIGNPMKTHWKQC